MDIDKLSGIRIDNHGKKQKNKIKVFKFGLQRLFNHISQLY